MLSPFIVYDSSRRWLAATGLHWVRWHRAGIFSRHVSGLPLRLASQLFAPGHSVLTFMGIILERSGMAEDLLETAGQVFGPVLVVASRFLVGALLAATTGVVAAAVISMGLISLPIMLRYGYSRTIATGTITASGTLAQAIPPSLVLIVLADQLGRSVGDMYSGALIPGLMLVGLYILFIVVVAIVKPDMVPALPPEALLYQGGQQTSGPRPFGSGGACAAVDR